MNYIVYRRYRWCEGIDMSISNMRTLFPKLNILAFNFLLLCSTHVLSKELFVATNGNDSVTYENNGISQPWRTITKGIYSLKAGDTLNIRGGTYLQANPLTIHSEYRNHILNPNLNIVMNAETGTVDKPITVKNYNGEEVVLDLINTPTFLLVDGKEYWTFDGLKFINAGTVFYIGDDVKTYHTTYKNLTINAVIGFDNGGVIKTSNENAEYTIIQNNKISGNLTTGYVSGCIYSRRIRHLKILNNECVGFPIGIYYKHRTHTAAERGDSEPVDIEIAYNLIEGSSWTPMYINTREARIHNNIIGKNNNGLINTEASGDTGGDFNIYEHNTFFSGALNMLAETQPSTDPRTYTQYPDAYPGSRYNTLKNNVFVYDPALHWYSPTLPHNTTSNYNLFWPTKAIRANGVTYVTLSSWQAASGQDANSLQGTPVFVGGAVPATIAGYALTSASPGYRRASDGKDMGADVAKVGVQKSGGVSEQVKPLPQVFY